MLKMNLTHCVDGWSACFVRLWLVVCATGALGLSLTGEGAEPTERYRRVNWVENYDTSAALPGATNVGHWAAIDTGVTPTANLGVRVDYEYKCFASAGGYMVAAYKSDNPRYYYVSVNKTGQWRVAHGTTSVISATGIEDPGTGVNVRYEVTLQGSVSGLAMTVRTGDETVGSKNIDGAFSSGTETPPTLGLFANYTGKGYSNPSYARLYSCELWTANGTDGKTALRDFVPCFDTTEKKFGVYDTINGQFYSSGNGNPLYGTTAPLPPPVTDFVYDGQPHGIPVPENEGYTIESESVTSATAAGTYTVTLRLNDGYVWSDMTVDATRTFTWTIFNPPTAVTTNAIPGHADWGYQITVEEESGNRYVNVYTNWNDAAMSWQVPSDVTSIDYLVVGGGGGGGKSGGGTAGTGGGGAGGFLRGTLSVTAGASLNVKVGKGGDAGASGGNSSLGTVVANGGGRGAGYDGNGTSTKWAAEVGGSGGGALSTVSARSLGISGQGNEGGGFDGFSTTTGVGYAGGGGGGARSAGTAGSKTGTKENERNGGIGGAGLVSSITGTSVCYAGGGGGGGGYNSSTTGAAGSGSDGGGAGGKAGASSGKGTAGSNGTNGLGSGGGGSGAYSTKGSGGRGGSGVVIISYKSSHLQRANSWTTEPSVSRTTWKDGDSAGTLSLGAAEYGTVTCNYTQDDLNAFGLGVYTVTFTVAETEDYTGLEKSVTIVVMSRYTVTTNAIPDHAEWGYQIDNLGANGDEVALVFTNTAATMDFDLPYGVTSIWYLVVGGGGSGGVRNSNANVGGGGGGAGGYWEQENCSLGGMRSISVTVGKGGAGVQPATSKTSNGNSGSPSKLSFGQTTITAEGGGYGAGSGAGGAGGSGGGAACNGTLTASQTGGGVYVAGHGNKGGGYIGASTGSGGGGGGGGAGSEGVAGASGAGGSGGYGLQCAITGVSCWYCAGGYGGARTSTTRASGDNGGGGAGGAKSSGKYDGLAATTFGSGGGGACGNGDNSQKSGKGYQGVVIVRYTLPAPNEPEAGAYIWKDNVAAGTWSAANWLLPTDVTSPADAPNGAGTVAKFATLDGPTTVTLDADVTVADLAFCNAAPVTIAFNGHTLTEQSAVTVDAAAYECADVALSFASADDALLTAAAEGMRFGRYGSTGAVTLSFAVPASGWNSAETAPVRASAGPIVIEPNVTIEVDLEHQEADGSCVLFSSPSGVTLSNGCTVVSGNPAVGCHAELALSADGKSIVVSQSPNVYAVRFDPNPGELGEVIGTMDDEVMTNGQERALTANAFVRTRHEFLGWSTTPVETAVGNTAALANYANGATFVRTEEETDAVVTLYAVWRPRPTSVTLDANGGTGGGTTTAYYDLMPTDSLPAPTKDGVTFIGYYDGVDSGVRYFDENGAPVHVWDKASESVMLYAHWSNGPVSVGEILVYDTTGGDRSFVGIYTNVSEAVAAAEADDGTSFDVMFGAGTFTEPLSSNTSKKKLGKYIPSTKSLRFVGQGSPDYTDVDTYDVVISNCVFLFSGSTESAFPDYSFENVKIAGASLIVPGFKLQSGSTTKAELNENKLVGTLAFTNVAVNVNTLLDVDKSGDDLESGKWFKTGLVTGKDSTAGCLNRIIFHQCSLALIGTGSKRLVNGGLRLKYEEVTDCIIGSPSNPQSFAFYAGSAFHNDPEQITVKIQNNTIHSSYSASSKSLNFFYLNQRNDSGLSNMNEYRDIILENNEFYAYSSPGVLASTPVEIDNEDGDGYPIGLIRNDNDGGTFYKFTVWARGNHLNGYCWNYVGEAVEDHKIVNAQGGHDADRQASVEGDAWFHKIGYYDNGVFEAITGDDWIVTVTNRACYCTNCTEKVLLMAAAPDCEYTGEPRRPTLTFTNAEGTVFTLVKDTDYMVEWKDNTDITSNGLAKARITAADGDWVGTSAIETDFHIMGNVYTWVGTDNGEGIWEDKNCWDREGVGIGNRYPSGSSDTIRFTNGVFTVHVTTSGSVVKKYVDEEGTDVTFVNEFDADAYHGFYGSGNQTCKGKIVITSTTGKRNVGFCVANNCLYLEGEIVCSNLHATAVNIDNQGPPVGGQGYVFSAPNAAATFYNTRINRGRPQDGTFIATDPEMPVGISVLDGSDLVHNDKTTNSIGQAATLVVDHSRLLAGVDPESFNGAFTFNEAVVGLSVQTFATDTMTLTNLTISGEATKLGITHNVDAAAGEWTFVIPAGGYTNDMTHFLGTYTDKNGTVSPKYDKTFATQSTAPVVVGGTADFSDATINVDATAITAAGTYPLVRVGGSGAESPSVASAAVTISDPDALYAHVEPATDGVGLDLVVEERIELGGVSAPNQTYASEVLTPDFEFTKTGGDPLEGLVEGVDYAVAWTNEAGVGISKEELVAAGTYTATVTGINRYKGTVSCPFTIDRKVLTIEGLEAVTREWDETPLFELVGTPVLTGVIPGDDVTTDPDPLPMKGHAWSLSGTPPNQKWGDGGNNKLPGIRDVYLEIDSKCPATNIVLQGEASANYVVTPPVLRGEIRYAEITSLELKSPAQSTYDGADKRSSITNGAFFVANGKECKHSAYIARCHYKFYRDEACGVEATDLTSVGTIWVVLEANDGNISFVGAATNSYTILPREITGAGQVEIELDPEEYAWTGHDIVPQFKVWDRSLDDALVPEDQYMAFYENNRAPTDGAKLLVMMKDNSNWKGSVLTNFWITAYDVEYYQDGERIGGAERFGAVSERVVYARVSVPEGHCLDWQNSETNGVVRRYDHSVADTHNLLTLRVRYETDENGDGVPDKYQRKLYFKVAHGYWNDGSRYDVPFWVTLMTGDRWDVEGCGRVSSDLVPAVGDRPFDSTYDKSGVWFPESEEVTMDTLPFRLFVYKAKSSVSGRGRGGRSGSAEPTMTSLSAVKSIRSFAVGQNEAVFNLGVAVVEQGTGATVIEADLNDMRVEFETTDSLGGGWTGVKVMTDGKGDATLKTGSAASRFYQLRK